MGTELLDSILEANKEALADMIKADPASKETLAQTELVWGMQCEQDKRKRDKEHIAFVAEIEEMKKAYLLRLWSPTILMAKIFIGLLIAGLIMSAFGAYLEG